VQHEAEAGAPLIFTSQGETMIRQLKDFLRNESGMETVEWAIVAGLIIIGVVAAFTLLGQSVKNRVTQLGNEVK
jgi:Flp pilus assembly pilin Flp